MELRPLGIATQAFSFLLPWPTAITLALYFNTEFSVFDTTLEFPMYTDLGTEGSVRNEVQDSWIRKICSCKHTEGAEVHFGFPAVYIQ